MGILTILNLAAMATAGYAGTTYLNSNHFCGTACHSAMQPEYDAYLRSPHQRVACVKCHVEPGAKGFIMAKLNGTRQLVNFLRDEYRRPIPTPIHNKIADEKTCETCHWPEKYLGTKLLVKPHYRIDEDNSSYTNVVLLRTGGTRADGESVGIHWHVHPDSVVEYIAGDPQRSTIPWVRMKRPDGTEDIFTSPGVDPDHPPEGEILTMECTDCHNRAAHAFEQPGEALDEALAAGVIPRDLPFAKRNAMLALNGEWTRDNAADGIRQHLQKAYAETGSLDEPTRQKLERTIDAVTEIWMRNVFPDRGLDWNTYPNLSGHVGCFRCHDGQHVNRDGLAIFGPRATQATAAQSDRGACSQCHEVLSENSEDPQILDSLGLGRE